MKNLENIAKKIVENGKGILAADESDNTIKKRFDSIDVESTEKARCNYREILFSTIGISEFISGVILFEETFFQKNEHGKSLREILKKVDCFPGIKVDQGLGDFNNNPNETYTKGIETLNERLKPFEENGAKFTKWRAVINISENNIPTNECIQKNSELLAEYASISQKNNLVPIVEPEIIMEGKHNLEKCFEVTKKTLGKVFECLKNKNVNLRGILLKPNTIVPGNKSDEKLDIKKTAQQTIKCLNETVPNEVPGIIFLSGGLSSLDATMVLNEINRLGKMPWKLSFSFGRALQENALKTWLGKNENKIETQKVFLHRARMNSLACLGKWDENLEKNIDNSTSNE